MNLYHPLVRIRTNGEFPVYVLYGGVSIFSGATLQTECLPYGHCFFVPFFVASAYHRRWKGWQGCTAALDAGVPDGVATAARAGARPGVTLLPLSLRSPARPPLADGMERDGAEALEGMHASISMLPSKRRKKSCFVPRLSFLSVLSKTVEPPFFYNPS